jgi:hypothetical protein
MDSPSDLETGRAFVRAGHYLEALQHYAVLLRDGDDRVDVYRDACQALIGALSTDVPLSQWSERERQEFLAALVLQKNCEQSPPILHFSIVSQYTSGASEVLKKASKILGPVVKSLLQKEVLNKNLVLLILVLREALGREVVEQSRISALHWALIDKFSLADMELPYNFMFDHQKVFARNRDDIVSKLAASPTADLLIRFSLSHLVFFEWLSDRTVIGLTAREWLTEFKARLSRSVSEIELCAARSLLVRYGGGAESEMVRSVPQIDEHTLRIADEAAAVRSKLEAATKSAPLRRPFGTRLFHNRVWQGAVAAGNLVRARAPAISSFQRRLKVAVCVSGQLRGYQPAFESWKGTLLKDVDYDLFVHSWKNVGRSGAEPFRHVLPFDGKNFVETYRRLCLEEGFDSFKVRYPHLFARLADTGRVTEQQISGFYRTSNVRLDDDLAMPFAALSNQEKMHSKIKFCFDMAVASGGEYDLVIRLRPDKPIRYLGYRWHDLLDICRRSPLLFADFATGAHYTNPMIGDQFAVGTLPPMQVYSSTWSLYPPLAATRLLNCAKPFVGHVSLAQVCWLHGIKVSKVPIRFGQLQEPAQLSSAVIAECLELDAEGRKDRIDGLLLDAVAIDQC